MSLDPYIQPWKGIAYRHLPDHAGVQFYDFSRAGKSAFNRWNTLEQPALYFAGDTAIALGEWSRHMALDRGGLAAATVHPRRVFQVEITLDAVIDLRDPNVCNAIALTGAPLCFLTLTTAQSTATYVRSVSTAQAILVPSTIFMDDLTRWNLVLFLDRVADPRVSIQIIDDSHRFQVP